MSIYEGLELLPQDLRGWNGTKPIFADLVYKTNPETIIEVGTWKGQSAITMGKLVTPGTKIYCVDTWLGALEFIEAGGERNLMLKNGYPQVYYQFLSNVVHNGLQDTIIPFPQTSAIAARWFKKKDIKAELIYIDGSHDEQDVYDDLCNYYDLCTGILFGDDLRAFQDVEIAVTRFCKERDISFTTVDDNFWVIDKR